MTHSSESISVGTRILAFLLTSIHWYYKNETLNNAKMHITMFKYEIPLRIVKLKQSLPLVQFI